MFGDSYFVGTFDQVLEPLTNVFQDFFNSRFSPLMLGERDKSYIPLYRTKRDVVFSFQVDGSTVSGVIPKGFLCDGMSVNVGWPLKQLLDRLFFKMWLVHDWLYNHRKATINGINTSISESFADKVFPMWMQLVLAVASNFTIKTQLVRFSAHKLTPYKNLLISEPHTKIFHQ